MTILSWDDKKAKTKFEYKKWLGHIIEMPELRQDENGIVNGPKQYIFQSVKRWMDPLNNGEISKGVDGWRLDCANFIKPNFWKDFRKFVRSINPEALIIGEILKEE